MKTYKYVICHPSGEISKPRITTIFQPYEVAKRLPHSLVFLFVPKGHDVYACGGKAVGPTHVYVTKNDMLFDVELLAINSEHDAYEAWNTLRLAGTLNLDKERCLPAA